MIYFIQSGGNDGKIKIGYTSSKNVERRLYGLQVGSPQNLSLIGVMQGEIKSEIDIHKKFKHLHYRGEWFDYSTEIIEFINNCATETNSEICETNEAEIDIEISGLKYMVEKYEAAIISSCLKKCDGNKSLAAKILKVSRPTLHAKISQYGLKK